LLREFSDVLRAELDYGREAANVKFFRNVFANEPGFKIPVVIEEQSKKRVLTEERVEGRKPSDVADLPKRRRAAVARRIARFVLEPAFERGVFYADPHPGNLLVQEDGSLSVIDFGKVGRLTPEQRRLVADIFIAIVRRDAQRLTDRLIEITAPTHPIDRALITSEVDRMLQLYVDVSLEHVQFGAAMGELLQLVRRHGLRLPGTLVQFFKALAMCEGILETVDPDSSFSDYLQPMIGKLVYQAFAGPQFARSSARFSGRHRRASYRTASTNRPSTWRDRTRESASLDAHRRHRAAYQTGRASRCTVEYYGPRCGVHRGACHRHAVLPSARMATVDRRGVLDSGCDCSHRLRKDLADLA